MTQTGPLDPDTMPASITSEGREESSEAPALRELTGSETENRSFGTAVIKVLLVEAGQRK